MKAILLAGALSLTAVSALAAPVTYKMDPAHTYPSFEADHMGISTWRGKFNHSQGWVEMDQAAGTGSLEVGIALKSIDFGQDALNKWAVGPEFFDTAKYPTAVYKGKLEGFKAGGNPKVTGDLTLHGVTKPVTLKINSFKCIEHPFYKKEDCGADAEGDMDRADWGMKKGAEWGGTNVHLRIQVEALKD